VDQAIDDPSLKTAAMVAQPLHRIQSPTRNFSGIERGVRPITRAIRTPRRDERELARAAWGESPRAARI